MQYIQLSSLDSFKKVDQIKYIGSSNMIHKQTLVARKEKNQTGAPANQARLVLCLKYNL